MNTDFHYVNGEVVRVGDRVKSVGNRCGVVKELLPQGSEVARQFMCPDGGVMVIEDWNGISSPRIMAVPGDRDWEDIVLIARVSS